VRNDTWDLVSLPKGKHIIGTKWVYKTKYKPYGTIDKYKAHLVAKGYMHKRRELIILRHFPQWQSWIQSGWYLHWLHNINGQFIKWMLNQLS